MTRFFGENRRESTKKRDALVHETYRQIIEQLGDMHRYVSRTYIYERIRDKTGLCVKTIAFILNHTIL